MQKLHERKFVVVYVMWGPTVNYMILREKNAMRCDTKTYESTLFKASTETRDKTSLSQSV